MLAQLKIAQMLFAYARLRAEAVRDRRDNQWGATAVEWAIISAIVVAAAVGLGIAIRAAVQGKQDDLCGEEGIEC